MAAELNELFEEAITRSRELVDVADHAADAIDRIVEKADAVCSQVEGEAGEACKQLHDFAAGLAQHEAELESARSHGEGALEGLAGKAAELREEVGRLLERVGARRSELEAQEGRLDDSLEAHMTSIREDFPELAEKDQASEAEANRHLEQAEQAIAAFRTAIDLARVELGAKKEAWAQAAASLEAHAHEQADEWEKGLYALLARQATALTNASNTMIDHHNEAMARLRERFVDQAPKDLASALEPLRAALQLLGETAASRQLALSARAQELGQRVAQALPVIETIQAALETTVRLA